jgi:hypothetical protein
VVYATSTKDVASLVEFTRANSLDVAVCGAGHSRIGASSTNGGVCIDLSKMQAISVDTNTNHITVQGGAVLQDVYMAVEKYGLALVGGLCGNVGIGGFALMGGYGWLTGAHGLAVDNIVQAEIVLADGSVVIASRSENPDLYWAIRGAGPCFGIATSIVFQGFVQGPVWSGELTFSPAALGALVGFANHVLSVSKGESSMVMIQGQLPGSTKPLVIVEVFYNGTEDEARGFFAPLLKLGPIKDSTKMMPFSQTTGGGDDIPPGFGKGTGGGIMEPIDADFVESLYEDYVTFIKNVPDASESLIAYEIHPTYGTLLHSQNETAFPNRGTFGNVVIYAAYTKDESAPACEEWCRKMHDKIHNEFERRKEVDGVDDTTKTGVGEYINYDGKRYLLFILV